MSRQFELDLLAQRGELLMSEVRPGFCSAFRASNLQGALHLLEELRQAPISYKPRHHPPDNRGYSEYNLTATPQQGIISIISIVLLLAAATILSYVRT